MNTASSLRTQAEGFVSDLNDTIVAVLGEGLEDFEAVHRSGGSNRVIIQPVGAVSLPLRIDGVHALNLAISFHCTWDSSKAFLKTERADIHVLPTRGGAPLFRFEFVDGMRDRNVPTAHLQVHAHRDEFLFAMLRGTQGKSSSRAKAAIGEGGKMPMLASVHFPLGGARFRPCLEDVLQMLIHEFNIDHTLDALDALEAGREAWRRRQIRAAVRDAPEEAVTALTDLGFTVTSPTEPPAANLRSLTHP